MAIINNKEIYDHSKSELLKLNKDLQTIIKTEQDLIKTNKALSESLQQVKKTSDGEEAKKLAAGTEKLTKSTKKLKDAFTAEERVKQQIIKQNAKLAESRTKAAKDLALVRQRTLQANKALREQAKASIGVRKSFAGLGKQLVGAAGLLGGMSALVSVVKDAFRVFVDFQKSASKLQAISRATTKEIKVLTKQAKELGSTTAFTATQILKAGTELAKLGFEASQIPDAIPGVLNLAAATGTDLAQSAEIAASTLKIFNLDASETTRVADVLALSTTKSSLSMEKLSVIMPIVGKTAEIANLSLEETTALAGTLTDRGLDASSAATSLRNIFLELSKKGLTWNEAMTQINESTDKNKTAMDLFGKRAAAAGVILSETADSTDILTEALNDAEGAALEMSEAMLDNLAGDITIAQSAWEGFILSIEDGEGVISKFIRGAVQDFTDFLGQLTLFNEVGIVDKLKLIANAALALFEKAFIPLIKVLETLGVEVPKFRFEVERTSDAIDDNTTSVEKNKTALAEETKEVVKLTAAQKKLIEQRRKDQEIIEQRQKDLVEFAENEIQIVKSIGEIRAETEEETQDNLNSIIQNASDRRRQISDEETANFIKNGMLVHEATAAAGQQIGDLMAQGLLTFKAFGKILLETTLSLVQKQVNIWLAGLLAREVFGKGFAGLATFGVLSLAVNTALQAAKSAVANFNEGTEYVPGTGNTDTVPAMLTPGERVVPAEINRMLGGIPNADLPNLLNKQDNNMMLAGLLMNMNKTNEQMLTALLNNGFAYTRDGKTYLNLANGYKETFKA